MLRRIVLAAVLIASAFVGIVAGWQFGLRVLVLAALVFGVLYVLGVGADATHALELGALWERSRGHEPLEPDRRQTQALTRVKSWIAASPENGMTRKPSHGVMPKVGIEPTLPEGNRILSPARLPVPPLRLVKSV